MIKTENVSFIASASFRGNRKRLKKIMSKSENLPCPYCNSFMRWDDKLHPALATVDHIHPRSKGGSNQIENLLMVCKNCNTRKGNLDTVTLFYLNQPMALNELTYNTLNDYTTCYLRIDMLNQILKKVERGDVHEIFDLIEEFKHRSYGKGYFYQLLKYIRATVNKTLKFELAQKTILRKINHKIRMETDVMNNRKKKLKQVPFSLYTLTTTMVQTAVIKEDLQQAA